MTPHRFKAKQRARAAQQADRRLLDQLHNALRGPQQAPDPAPMATPLAPAKQAPVPVQGVRLGPGPGFRERMAIAMACAAAQRKGPPIPVFRGIG